jgi:hypothetical protein
MNGSRRCQHILNICGGIFKHDSNPHKQYSSFEEFLFFQFLNLTVIRSLKFPPTVATYLTF